MAQGHVDERPPAGEDGQMGIVPGVSLDRSVRLYFTQQSFHLNRKDLVFCCVVSFPIGLEVIGYGLWSVSYRSVQRMLGMLYMQTYKVHVSTRLTCFHMRVKHAKHDPQHTPLHLK